MQYSKHLERQAARLVNNHGQFTFPQFLRELRQLFSLSKIDLSRFTKIRAVRLRNLERHEYGRIEPPSPDELRVLAEFYGLEEGMLRRKSHAFLGPRVRKRRIRRPNSNENS